MNGDKSTLREEQHLTMEEAGYPDWYRVGQAEADYLLPLESDDVSTLKMAVAMLEERAANEGDDETMQKARALYLRLKYDGLVKSGAIGL